MNTIFLRKENQPAQLNHFLVVRLPKFAKSYVFSSLQQYGCSQLLSVALLHAFV